MPHLNSKVLERKEVRKGQVELLYKQTWTGLTGVLIVALSLAVLFWDESPRWKLSLWLCLMILTSLGRGIQAFVFYRQRHRITDLEKWASYHVVGTVASGILWAIPSILFWPNAASVYQLVWPICILPLSAAAVATYYTWTPSYVSFLLISAVPVAIRFFVQGGFLFSFLGFLTLFFIAVLLRAGRVMNAATIRTFESEERLRVKNQELTSLNEDLTTIKSELETTNHKLEEAMANIKQLGGLLPICAACKNIRNDTGYWEVLESYLLKHSDVKFSHGICPDCIKKLYPDLKIGKEGPDGPR